MRGGYNGVRRVQTRGKAVTFDQSRLGTGVVLHPISTPAGSCTSREVHVSTYGCAGIRADCSCRAKLSLIEPFEQPLSRRIVVRIKFLAAGVMAIGFIGLMADVATADLQIQTYIYRDSQGNDQADPVNLLFVGNAVDTYVDAHIASLVGWTYSSGGTMYFDDHGGLQVQDYQRTSAPFWEDHHHVRIEYADDSGQE